MFWIPRLQPEAISLEVRADIAGFGALPIDLTQLSNFDFRQAEDGWHAIWQDGGLVHQFYLRDLPADKAAQYNVILPFDAFFELRLHAARRLWRILAGKSPGPPYRMMPEQLRNLHVLTLRALDAHLAGESYRMLAHHLLGFRGDKTDWESDPRKNKARRLVAAGKRLMQGGYRALLHYPVKLRRR